MTSAFGKVILLGEHAVVYGHPAIAGAIDRKVRCAVERIDAAVSQLEAPAWHLSARAGEGAVGIALAQLCAAGGVSEPVRVQVHSDLPVAAGLGSSAALCVACARALSEYAGASVDIETLANDAERNFHDNPSGIDVALAARGGLGMFVRGRGLESIAADPIAIVVGLTGQPRNTADMVRRVRDAIDADPARSESLRELGDAARVGRVALESGDSGALGQAMNRAHALLGEFELSTAAIDAMVEAARARGALGAKLTGAGGGGAVIALCPGEESEIERAWKDLGFEAFVCQVGVKS